MFPTKCIMVYYGGCERTVLLRYKKYHSKSYFVQLFCVNLYKGIYLFEIKRVRRITSFSGNELVTVLIAVVCIALLVRETLTVQRYEKYSD